MPLLDAFLLGMSAMGSLAAALFFLRFYRRTRDRFFLLFSAAFAIEGLSRLPLALEVPPNESEPFYYLPRLLAFSLIALAVVLKNRPDKS
ncbi:MAG TPA: DUF5985 family protein [Rhizomicrobium sp.]|nr:DUF5985 family protein [Rhizomicrobium sp.]